MAGKKARGILLLFPLFALLTCGLENYTSYLVPVDYVETDLLYDSKVSIPSQVTSSFRYYVIFYRIYLSELYFTSITTDSERQAVNPALSTHYKSLANYTDSDNFNPSVIGTVFSNLKYYQLYLNTSGTTVQSASDILNDQFLPTAAMDGNGDKIHIFFTGSSPGPYLEVLFETGNPATIQYPLRRASNSFTPHPDRTFYRTTGAGDICDNTIITSDVNADVEKLAGNNSTSYAYVSMYIAAYGVDSNLTSIYSRPTHIGIFRLES
jgi:hypothetical protein